MKRSQIRLVSPLSRLGAFDYNVGQLAGIVSEGDAGAIFVFPELYLCGGLVGAWMYSSEFKQMHDDALAQVKKLSKNYFIVVGGVGFDRGNLYDSVYVFGKGKLLARHDKQIFNVKGVLGEGRFFAAGKKGTVVSLGGLDCGICICYEISDDKILGWYKNKCDVLLHVAMQPYFVDRAPLREAELKKKSQLIKCPIFFVNGLSGQDGLIFDGGSLVVAGGTLLGKSATCTESILVCHLDKKISVSGGVSSVSIEESLWSALVFSLQEKVTSTGCQGVVLGLSGGVDSALVACLAVDALGANNVYAAFLPSKFTSEQSQMLYEALIVRLGLKKSIVSIGELHSKFEGMFGNLFAGATSEIVLENIQARIRGMILMGIANQQKSMLLATGNKSEAAMGYATLYGDTCGGFAPIGDLTKHWVYKLARFRNRNGEVIPEGILTREPTAELRFGQKDSDSLLPYDELDPIIEALLVPGATAQSALKKLPVAKSKVSEVHSKLHAAHFKRAQSCAAPRVTKQSFQYDYQYPIGLKFNQS
ncbi:MAG: NAD(+) synthase [Methylacidiphilales bacterium]|nr:NAD(+) synthase [Candidatus Methylacidiphilales bacterium]